MNELLNRYNLPFRLKAGLITGLRIDFFLSKWKSKPIEAQVNEILIVLGTVFNFHEENVSQPLSIEVSESGLDSKENEFIDELLSESTGSFDTYPYNYFSPRKIKNGAFDKRVQSILSNLALKINKLHIRFEDDIYNPEKPFSFGVMINQISL